MHANPVARRHAPNNQRPSDCFGCSSRRPPDCFFARVDAHRIHATQVTDAFVKTPKNLQKHERQSLEFTDHGQSMSARLYFSCQPCTEYVSIAYFCGNLTICGPCKAKSYHTNTASCSFQLVLVVSCVKPYLEITALVSDMKIVDFCSEERRMGFLKPHH